MSSVICVVVGDKNVGKTTLLNTYTKKSNLYYSPSIFPNYTNKIIINNKTVNVQLWDTTGQEEFDKLRCLSYAHSDVIVLCYSVNNIESFENIKSKWYPEIYYHCPNNPIILVGLIASNLNDTNKNIITTNQGKKLANDINAYKFIESSLYSLETINNIFKEAIISTCNNNSKQKQTIKSDCLLL